MLNISIIERRAFFYFIFILNQFYVEKHTSYIYIYIVRERINLSRNIQLSLFSSFKI